MATSLIILPRVDLTVEVFTNEDWLDALAFYDLDGNPLSLAGIHFALEARHNVEDATAGINITSDPGGGITIVNNEFHIYVPVEHMTNMARDDYAFDVVGTADGIQRVIMTGTLTVLEGITR